MMVDMLRALCVLALIFLMLGHKPVLAQDFDQGPTYGVTSLNSFCGGSPDSIGHAPCHACRLFTGLDLPPAPDCAEPAFRAAITFAWVQGQPLPALAPWAPRANPARAPPLA
jgi:hypothetical protein